MAFKEYIKNLRSSLGITQDEASKRIDVSLSTIQNWERGDNKPDMNSISNIANVYNVKPGDIVKMLAKELDSEHVEHIEDNNSKKEEYIDVMPNELDYSPIECLSFTLEEQELFLILSLSIECCGDTIPLMYQKTGNYLDIAVFLDKLKEYDLYLSNLNIFIGDGRYSHTDGVISSREFTLSEKGVFIFNTIKESKGVPFDAYSIGFTSFIKLCKLYGIDKEIYTKTELIKDLVGSDNYYLNTFEQYEWDEKRYYNRSVNPSISGVGNRKEALGKYLGSDYYDLVEVECNEELYLIEKESYLKKLEFYENHKDLNDGLVKPGKYQERIYERAVPTEKAIKFMEYYKK